MTNIINASSGGIVQTGSSTTALNIQTAGTTAIAIDASQNVSVTASLSATTVTDSVGNVRNIPSAGTAKTSNYTLAITDIGEFVTLGASGSITVPNDIFAAGNAVAVYNNTSSNATISLTITTAYIGGTDSDKAFVTLATRGITTILFVNPSLCILTGNIS